MPRFRTVVPVDVVNEVVAETSSAAFEEAKQYVLGVLSRAGLKPLDYGTVGTCTEVTEEN